MSITKNLVVTLKDDVAELKDKMFIFRNDVGVEMIIELKDFEYSIDAVGNKNNFSKVSAIFRTPSSKLYSYNDIKVSNGKIRFVFTQDLINVMQEIGEYELQFQLYDKLNNRLTIPSYNFYVKEPLSLPNEVVVEEGIVGLSYVTDDKIIEWDNKSAFSGNYNDLTNKPTSLPANGGNASTVGGYSLWVGTQVQYDAIATKSDTTIYIIKEE